MTANYGAGVAVLLGLAVAVTGSVPSVAQGIAYTMGEIGRRASYGNDGDWLTAASRDGSLLVSSQSANPGWTAEVAPAPVPPYTITVQVHHEFPPVKGRAVGAGLVFGLQRASGSQGPRFCAALLSGDELFVYSYDDGGFAQHLDIDNPRSRAQFDTLRVAVRNDGLTLTLNTNTFNIKLDCSHAGDLGVMTSGRGSATFRNLVVQ